MNKETQFSPLAIIELKEALSVIYWKREDLQDFIKLAIENNAIVSTINWTVTKRESVKELIERMVNRQDLYKNDLISLFLAVTDFNDFSNLNHWDEDGSKTKRAKEAVNNLRNQTKRFIQLTKELEDAQKRKAEAAKNVLNEKQKRIKEAVLKKNIEWYEIRPQFRW